MKCGPHGDGVESQVEFLLMSLDEYKRKRRFEATPEPPAVLDASAGHRFVVQRHEATRLHYDFRLEMDGVLKSWAVPKGPSLDPDDKRLAMQVEDHPVSYFSFEGMIPEGNYGAGTVMVWDVGQWQPLSPVPVAGKFVPGTDKEAAEMLAKGDLKFRLEGKKLRGDFALVRMRSRRPGTKGNEWLMIKKRDDQVVEGYDAEEYDNSALSNRSMREIASQHDAEWVSRPAGPRGKLKAAWLADAVAKLDEKKRDAKKTVPPKASSAKRNAKVGIVSTATEANEKPKPKAKPKAKEKALNPPISTAKNAVQKKDDAKESSPAVAPSRAPMPAKIQPMLATAADKPFNDDAWLFEIKWDGYRAIAFLEKGMEKGKEKSKVRLVSRNQNDMTAQYPELAALPGGIRASTAVLDGEIVALDEEGRSSFSLMQQRAGFSSPGKRSARRTEIPVLYYAFDLLYLDGEDLRKLPLEQRKHKLAALIAAEGVLRYSDHVQGQGVALFEVARQKGLEGILAKRRSSAYEERRSSNWLKIKITHRIECVVGGYTEPQRGRKLFGSVVLGLYNTKGELIHVGQAGSGFDENTLASVWKELERREVKKSPFTGKVEALRGVRWVKPELVAEIKFGEWTHAGDLGSKLRAPVFLGLRWDKPAKDCVFEQ